MKKLISIRIDANLLQALREEAKRDNRSLNNTIEVALSLVVKKLQTKRIEVK